MTPPAQDGLPAAGGTYCLILRNRVAWRGPVGRLQDCGFAAGWYVYVGSAFGTGGLRARLRHHLRISGRPRWHIDYLRSHMDICEIWYSVSQRHAEVHRVPVSGLGHRTAGPPATCFSWRTNLRSPRW